MRPAAAKARYALALVAGMAYAGAAGADGGVVNHLDVGIVPYMINTHYGGAKAEARVNLAPGSDTAGLYLTGGLGRGTWSDRIGPFIPWFSSDANYSKWKTHQKLYTDLGMAVTYKTTAVSGGLFWVNYDSDVHKRLNSVDYYAVGVAGSRMGGWLQLGYEIPIQRWLAGVAVGYRETREPVNVPVASATGSLEHVTVRPVRGVYATVSLRFSLL